MRRIDGETSDSLAGVSEHITHPYRWLRKTGLLLTVCVLPQAVPMARDLKLREHPGKGVSIEVTSPLCG
jgi:hypothetical protein